MIVFGLAIAGLAISLRLAPLWSSEPNLGHGWIVACYLLWWWIDKWESKPAANPSTQLSLPAAASLPLILLLIVAPLRLFLTPFADWPSMLWAWTLTWMALVSAGLCLAGGKLWLRHFAFGIFLVCATLPWPQVCERALFDPLREWITLLTVEALNLLGYPALAHGTTLQVLSRWVGMEEACSGLRSFQLSIALSLILGEIAGLKKRYRFLLLASGCALAIGMNFVRVLLLSLAVARGNEMTPFWHDASGYGIYVALTLMLGLFCWYLRTADHRRSFPSVGDTPSTDPIFSDAFPKLWFSSMMLGFAILEAGAYAWFAPGNTEWRNKWTVEFPATAPRFAELPLGTFGMNELKADLYKGASWTTAADPMGRVAFYIEWRSGPMTGGAHNPTVCFPNAGCHLEKELGTLELVFGGQTIPFAGYEFSRKGQMIAAYFTIWDTDLQRSLLDNSPRGGALNWYKARWAQVMSRRSKIRTQLLTFAVISNDPGDAQILDAPFIKNEIRSVLRLVGAK
jgi:exosortase